MMELQLKKEELLRGVTQTQSIAERRSSMPILSNVLLEAHGDGRLDITATDLEITFRGSYTADVQQEGRLTVPARKFYEIVRMLADEELTLKETDNFNLVLTGSRSTYQLHGLSPDDYPPMPDHDDVVLVDIPVADLTDMIEKTIYSIAMEETRYNLAGVYFEKSQTDSWHVLRLVSTDGHRLSMAERSLDGLEKMVLEKGVIISRKGVAEMRKMAESAETLQLGFTGNSAVLKAPEAVLVMRLLEGRFPDYRLVVPKGNDREMKAGRKEFLEMVRRVSIMSSDDFKGVKFVLAANELTLIAVNPELGEARESLPVLYDGENVEIGFNPRYFIDTFSALRSDEIRMALKDGNSPCIMTADQDPGFLSVIMPMKI